MMSPEIRILEVGRRQEEENVNVENIPNYNFAASTTSTDSETEYDNEIRKVQRKLDIDDPDFRAKIRPKFKQSKFKESNFKESKIKVSKFKESKDVSPILREYASMPISKRKPGEHFTDDQINILQDMLKLTSFPNRDERMSCSVATGLKLKAVNSWYNLNGFG